MLGDSLNEALAPKGINALVRAINYQIGNFKSYLITDRLIRSVTGSKTETTYYDKIEVTYERGTADERIGLIKRGDSGIKINSYHGNFK